MKLLEEAIRIAVEAHRGQTDKAGAPYILHPLLVWGRCFPERVILVVVLNVFVLYTDWTLEQLGARGFSDDVLAAVDCLTRREAETYEAFIERVRTNPVARAVKLADLEDNMDIHRIGELTERDLARLTTLNNCTKR